MYEQVQKIHDFAIKSIARDTLLPKGTPRSQLKSCLDAIGDSELAIAAYSAGEFGVSDGVRYLAVYGLLQALFIQQDAVRYLCESLGMPNPLNNYPRLKEIREIRNASIGHPTKKDRPKPTSYHFISRPTLRRSGFQLLSILSEGNFRFEDVSIPDLVADQRTNLSEILTSVIGKLEHDEKAHKEKFMMEKLASFFPATLDYYFEKVREGTTKTTIEHVAPAAVGLYGIKKALQNFREALAKRGVTYDSINYVCELLEYPLAELEAFFQNVRKCEKLNINEKTAFIFAFFLQKQFDELISMAKEVDEDYSN